MINRWTILTLVAATLVATGARAVSYALIAGSNRGGPGQEDLRYAREDALRVQEVITELGGVPEGNVSLVLDPDRDELLSALADLHSRLAAHAKRGEETVFLFYYSGHARAHALNMGEDEVALGELRSRLQSMPATVTVAILDACQTGAISQVKGAEPAADFTHNLVSDLNTAGIAVMASSTASELSQESAELRASYFTHHLLSGLRGAADEDLDGRITLSEAYRYAYNRTLVATAATAVGKQHVTLETELRGKGEMVLTRPAQARSAVVLPGDLAADVLVHREPDRTVMAEVVKAAGDPVRLALPPGDFVVFLRRDDEILKCQVNLAEVTDHQLAVVDCVEATPEEIGIKGEIDDRYETWALEFGLGGLWGVEDAYNRTLEDFGFDPGWLVLDASLKFNLTASYSFSRYLSVQLNWMTLDRWDYTRTLYDLEGQEKKQTFEWSAYGLGITLRATLPLLDGVLNPYVQAGGGLAWGVTEFRDPLPASVEVDDQLFWGFHLTAAAGVQFMPWRHLGVFGQVSYTYAPAIENEVGDLHDSGGPGVVVGVRGGF